jgi:hypothetical protein
MILKTIPAATQKATAGIFCIYQYTSISNTGNLILF